MRFIPSARFCALLDALFWRRLVGPLHAFLHSRRCLLADVLFGLLCVSFSGLIGALDAVRIGGAGYRFPAEQSALLKQYNSLRAAKFIGEMTRSGAVSRLRAIWLICHIACRVSRARKIA